jgi:hypothetical protein
VLKVKNNRCDIFNFAYAGTQPTHITVGGNYQANETGAGITPSPTKQTHTKTHRHTIEIGKTKQKLN